MARTGRNDLCPCGSGRKFKKCCELKVSSARSSRALVILVGAIVMGALLVIVASSLTGGSGGGTRVWDPEHGHYHDANGVAVP